MLKKTMNSCLKLLIQIEGEVKKYEVVRRLKHDNKDLVIIETSIDSSDMESGLKKADEIMSNIQSINKLSNYKSFTIQIESTNGKILSYTKFVNEDWA